MARLYPHPETTGVADRACIIGHIPNEALEFEYGLHDLPNAHFRIVRFPIDQDMLDESISLC